MYNVCPCTLCKRPMSFDAVREGVYWAERMEFGSWWRRYWVVNEGFVEFGETVFAHAACWKRISEKRRELIRITSDDDFKPKCVGVLA